MCGTETGEAITRWSRLEVRAETADSGKLPTRLLCHVRYRHSVWRAYGAICSRMRGAIPGTDAEKKVLAGYALDTRCPVLTWCMVLPVKTQTIGALHVLQKALADPDSEAMPLPGTEDCEECAGVETRQCREFGSGVLVRIVASSGRLHFEFTV
eukprot:1512173-Rhodomonas_salina.4